MGGGQRGVGGHPDPLQNESEAIIFNLTEVDNMPTSYRHTVSVKTDGSGNFKEIITIKLPWLPFVNYLDLKGELLSPPNVKVDGSIDIDATDGSPSNDQRPFLVAFGQGPYNVGQFKVDGGNEEFRIEISGSTNPAQSNTVLTCAIEVS